MKTSTKLLRVFSEESVEMVWFGDVSDSRLAALVRCCFGPPSLAISQPLHTAVKKQCKYHMYLTCITHVSHTHTWSMRIIGFLFGKLENGGLPGDLQFM